MYTTLVSHFDKSTKLVKRIIFSLLFFFPSFFFISIFTFSAVSIFLPVFSFLYFFRSHIFFFLPHCQSYFIHSDGKKYKSAAFIIEFLFILFEISLRARMSQLSIAIRVKWEFGEFRIGEH